MAILRTGEDPPIYTTESGLTVAKTAGGNPVAAFSDEAGNIFLIDPNGNLYYDTGDPKLGVYFVRPCCWFPLPEDSSPCPLATTLV